MPLNSRCERKPKSEKLSEAQKKKIEQEEAKYQSEIDKATEALSVANDESQIALLNAKILELQGQLSDVVLKKDEISKLQNGKAGNVYIISNLGSFGENVFKIGMTDESIRRNVSMSWEVPVFRSASMYTASFSRMMPLGWKVRCTKF